MKLRYKITAVLLPPLLLLLAYGVRGPEFFDHSYEGFSIAVPAREPAERNEKGSDGLISSVSAEARGFKYVVVYWDLPLYLRGVRNAEILESMSLGAGAWKAKNEKPVTIAGMKGMEIEGKTANGKYMLTRMLRTSDRVYLLTIGGDWPVRHFAATSRFFDSFRLNP